MLKDDFIESGRPANHRSPVNWNSVADEFCLAWTSEVGRPNFDVLSLFYAPDKDVVIFDTLPPLTGFRGFEEMRQSIYGGLQRITVKRTGEVCAKQLACGDVVTTAYPFHLSYRFADGRAYEIDARISEVWERRNDAYYIVHEHPSTVHGLERP